MRIINKLLTCGSLPGSEFQFVVLTDGIIEVFRCLYYYRLSISDFLAGNVDSSGIWELIILFPHGLVPVWNRTNLIMQMWWVV